MTGGELLRQGAATLRQAGLDQPRLEAEVLLTYTWGRSREELLIHPGHEVPDAAGRQFLALVGERAGGMPTAYLTGAREFMSLMLTVTPAVLIPRPETELLVEEVLHWLESRSVLKSPPDDDTLNTPFDITPGYKKRSQLSAGETPRTVPDRSREAPVERCVVADVGTGSGAIAVSLAHYHPAVRVVAIDISEEALDVAAVNARCQGLADRVCVLPGDLLIPLLDAPGRQGGNAPTFAAKEMYPPRGGGTGSVVVANLPYVPTAGWDRLPQEVRREPRLALDGGGDGLDLYRRLLPQAAAWLAPGGLLACEIGPGQAEVLIELLQQGGWSQVRLIKDYRGEDRVLTAVNTC